MRGSQLTTKRVGYLATSLAIGVASVLSAAYITFWPTEATVSADGTRSETSQAVAADLTSADGRGTGDISSRGDRAPEGLVTSDSVDAGKGPGLASPPQSPLETAASAVAARNPGKTLRVGIQAGHWQAANQPDELAILRKSTGAVGPGWREVDINLDVSRRIAGILAPMGIVVDLIPATVPAGYKADAFVSIHGDANSNTSASGFKIARATKSEIPSKDDGLVGSITASYRATTGLSWDASTITQNMLDYYAFNQKLKHSVDAGTPSVIVELGFLTCQKDREILTTQSDQLAQSIALGILNFLSR